MRTRNKHGNLLTSGGSIGGPKKSSEVDVRGLTEHRDSEFR